MLASGAVSVGVLSSVAWVAFKVGALSYGGGFVIIPLMQADAVDRYHWMTNGQFLNAVALGQITPGPVVQTVAVVGYAAAGLTGGLLASAVAFGPSFAFVLLGARRFDQLRANASARAFLDGAGPAAIGAIAGSAISLARALTEPWQYVVLVGAAIVCCSSCAAGSCRLCSPPPRPASSSRPPASPCLISRQGQRNGHCPRRFTWRPSHVGSSPDRIAWGQLSSRQLGRRCMRLGILAMDHARDVDMTGGSARSGRFKDSHPSAMATNPITRARYPPTIPEPLPGPPSANTTTNPPMTEPASPPNIARNAFLL